MIACVARCSGAFFAFNEATVAARLRENGPHLVQPFDHACLGADAHLIVVAVQLVVRVNCVAGVPFAQCDNSAALIRWQHKVFDGLPVGDAPLRVRLVCAYVGQLVWEWPSGADGRQVERPRAALDLGELEHVGEFAYALVRVHWRFLFPYVRFLSVTVLIVSHVLAGRVSDTWHDVIRRLRHLR